MRLQVLHLPAPPDEYPFALVVDRLGPTVPHGMLDQLCSFKHDLGARAVFVFSDEVEIA